MRTAMEQCPECGSDSMHNILVGDGELPRLVYVRCGRCAALIARYALSEYYSLGASFESWLRSHGQRAVESGRQHAQEFERIAEEAAQGYEHALADLPQRPGGGSPKSG